MIQVKSHKRKGRVVKAHARKQSIIKKIFDKGAAYDAVGAQHKLLKYPYLSLKTGDKDSKRLAARTGKAAIGFLKTNQAAATDKQHIKAMEKGGTLKTPAKSLKSAISRNKKKQTML